jgi:hypothetical protein
MNMIPVYQTIGIGGLRHAAPVPVIENPVVPACEPFENAASRKIARPFF